MTKNDRKLKYLSFGLLMVLVLIMIVGSVLERFIGTTLVYNKVYTSPLTLAIWGIMAAFALGYLLRRKVQHMALTFMLHISFLLILGGALVTHCFGQQGTIHLRKGEQPVGTYQLASKQTSQLPFEVELHDFELEYYAGTFSPMDYVSRIAFIAPDGTRQEGRVSMNHICTYRHYRFYQSGYDRDANGTMLSISYDPYGIAITYIGYACLLLSMLGFFFQPHSRFRALFRHPVLYRMGAVCLFLLVSVTAFGASRPQTLSRQSAAAFGNLYIYYNDRICPLETVAKDFTIKLCGKSTYRGLTAAQVLSGWFFFYDEWKTEPMIRIKDGETKRLLGIEGGYASVTDFVNEHGFKLREALEQPHSAGIAAANEKFNLVSMASTGSLFKIYPYRLSENPTSVWYSLADKIPAGIPAQEWGFIRNSMSYVAERVAMRDYDEVVRLFGKIKKYQTKYADDLPSPAKFQAEKVYNDTNMNRPLAIVAVIIGILSFGFYCHLLLSRRKSRRLTLTLLVLMGLLSAYLAVHLGLRGYISGHLPMSDGFETMLFMAWCTTLFTLLIQHKFSLALPFGFLISGLAMMVAMIGESNPQVTHLIPVLKSPLLSIHVVVIMIAYSLLAFTLMNGIAALVLRFSHRNCGEEIEYLAVVSRIILYPAVFLLTVGIFVGAVWANVSWGRYWGWDPKEVWALITMLVYSLALHPSMSWLKRPMVLHTFCILAFLTVLITYFGVNYLLGGKHSYA